MGSQNETIFKKEPNWKQYGEYKYIGQTFVMALFSVQIHQDRFQLVLYAFKDQGITIHINIPVVSIELAMIQVLVATFNKRFLTAPVVQVNQGALIYIY